MVALQFEDVKLQKEIEFSREQLGTVIPNRLTVLLREIDAARNKGIYDWYVDLWVKIGNSVIRVCDDLFLTLGQESAFLFPGVSIGL